MSSRLYGVNREIADRLAAKYSPEREQEAREWIELVIEEQFPSDNFQESLKDGVILCKLLGKVLPGEGRFKASKMPFMQMENIATFLAGAEKLGCPKSDLFQTVDLYENKNVGQVVDAIFSFSRYATKNGFDAPVLGPKIADKNERQFSPEVMNAGKHIINTYQMGYAGGANQSGMTFGGARTIGDKPKSPSL